jgi:hypothetical protein
MNNWLQIASGIGLALAVVNAVVLAVSRTYFLPDRICGSILLVFFGYLFLSPDRTKEAGTDPPWWW